MTYPPKKSSILLLTKLTSLLLLLSACKHPLLFNTTKKEIESVRTTHCNLQATTGPNDRFRNPTLRIDIFIHDPNPDISRFSIRYKNLQGDGMIYYGGRWIGPDSPKKLIDITGATGSLISLNLEYSPLSYGFNEIEIGVYEEVEVGGNILELNTESTRWSMVKY